MTADDTPDIKRVKSFRSLVDALRFLEEKKKRTSKDRGQEQPHAREREKIEADDGGE